MSPVADFEQPYYLIDENLSVYKLKDTLAGRWRYWQDVVDLRPGVVVGGGGETPIPISPDGRLEPGKFYGASTGNVAFYLPTYRIHEEAGRFAVRLKWSADQQPDGPLANLSVDLDAVAPPIPPNVHLAGPPREIEHQAVLRLGYSLPVQGGQAPAGEGAFVGEWRNVDANTQSMTRLIVTPGAGGGATLHGFGKCTPTDCDWGETGAQLDAGRLVGVYDFGFKTTRLTLWLENQRLQAELFHHFTDNSGRPDRLERCEMALEGGGGPPVEHSSTLWIELGALQPQPSGVRRCVRALHAKAEFDRLYSVMTDPAFDAFLEVRCFATVGRRTWRQVVVGELDLNRQVLALVEKQALFTDLLNTPSVQFQDPVGDPGGPHERRLKLLVDQPQRLNWKDSMALVNERSAVTGALNPGENLAIIAAPLHSAVLSGVHASVQPPGGGNVVAHPPGGAIAAGPAHLAGNNLSVAGHTATSIHAASMMGHAIHLPSAAASVVAPAAHPEAASAAAINVTGLLANSRLFSSPRLFERVRRDVEDVTEPGVTPGVVMAQPGEVTAAAVSSRLNPALRDAFRKPVRQMIKDSNLQVTVQGRRKLAVPVRAILDPQGEPALISVSVESTQQVRPFHFSVETNAYIFDIPGDIRPDHSPVLLRQEVLDDDGEVLGVFYQDSSQPDQFYYQPQEFRLARNDSAPYLPEMRIVFYNLITQEEGQPEDQASLEYRVELAYRALPYVEPDVLALARQQAPSAQPRFAILLPESSTLSLRLPADDGQGDLVEVPRGEAEVHFDLGLIDQIDLSQEQFEQIFAAFQAPSGDGIEGAVQAALTGAAQALIPVRLSLQQTAGEVLSATYKGPLGGGLHRVGLRNRIESPVTIEDLYTVWLGPGVRAHPQTAPGARLAPGETLDLDYRVDPPDAPVAEINPALSASVQVDAEKLWPDLFENGGYTGDTYTIPVQTEPAFFGVTPPDAPGPLAALQVEFDAGPAVTLSADAPQTTATLRFPLLARLLGLPDARRYRYRVTNLHTSGEALAPGAQSDWTEETGGGTLLVQPAGA